MARGAAEIEEDLGKLGFLVAEMELWLRNGAVAAEVRETLLPTYELQLELAREHRRWVMDGEEEAEASAKAEVVAEVVAEREDVAEREAFVEREAVVESEAVAAPAPAPAAPFFPTPTPTPTFPAEPSVLVAPSIPVEHYEAPPVSGAGRLVQEVRPLVYENLILFLGAFLVFAGSLYFAIYFWERLGSFGPLVAGSLLAVYGSGFAGMGYLLQRRYQAELSARVLFGVATAIYPIAATLAGEPLAHAGLERPVLGLASAAAIALFTAAAYPVITVAASLFQREIAKPFTRAYLALMLAIGFAPLLLRFAPRQAALVFLYLAALPIAAMYRRVRELGRIYEPETVLYVVAGSAYLLVAVAIRVALLTAGAGPALTLPEVAPLAILLATAAIDLDVEWRRGPRGIRSALGAVGVLAHAIAVLAVVLACPHPVWRVITTLGAGALFLVAALRHRRPSALHLAIGTLTLGLFLLLWLPPLAPHLWRPRALGFAGVLLLPWSLALSRLAARWRRNAAPEYAAPVERWVLNCAALTALFTVAPLEPSLRLWDGGREVVAAALAAILMLPATVATQLLAWRWAHRPAYLTFATSLAVIAALVAARLLGLREPTLAVIASALTALVALASLRARRLEARQGLRFAAIALVALATAALLCLRAVDRPLPLPEELAALLLLGAASLAIAAGSDGWGAGLFAQLAFSAAAVLVLWHLLPVHLIAAVLALLLFALEHFAAERQLGQAHPFRHAYALSLVALFVHAMHMLSHSDDPSRFFSPLEPALVVVYALARWRTVKVTWLVRPSFHAALAAVALTGFAVTRMLGLDPSARSFLLLGAATLAAAELLSRSEDERNLAAVRVAFDWSAASLLVCALMPFAELPRLSFYAPLGAAAFAVCLVRARRFGISPLYLLGGRSGRAHLAILSIACVLAAESAALALLSLAELTTRDAFTCAVVALVAAAAGWAHWLARARLAGALGFDEPRAARFASTWNVVAALFAFGSGLAVTTAPDDTSLAALTLALAGVWFTRAALRQDRGALGFAAWLSFFALLVRLRLSPLAAALQFDRIADLDAITLVSLAFACHLVGELLERARLTALARPARSFVVALPLLAASLLFASLGPVATLRHALLFESIGVVYLFSFWRGGPRPLAFAATCAINTGLFLLWIHTAHTDPLFYAIPAGASIVWLARLYRDNLGPGARRGLHIAGCLLIYFSTYYRVVQFDSGVYPLLLGGLTLAGVALGFALQLRDLFLLSAGFLVLNVISNLAFYGVHRPLLGWTLLTVAGLGLTAAGVLFQLRRAELTALLARVRAHLHAWD